VRPQDWLMLAHALTIVVNELEKHLNDIYGVPQTTPQVRLGNIGEGIAGMGAAAGAVPREILGVSMVNIREEKTLKNVSGAVRNDATLRVVYQNPPIFLNFHILLVATHANYSDALLVLSRAIKFFQFTNVFDQNSVAPSSLKTNQPKNTLDQLESFKLIFDLYSPTMEEVNHLWGTLGGKQYPFVLYTLRLLEMQFKAVQSEAGLITQVVNDTYQKSAAG
jgi:hypothetical protein